MFTKASIYKPTNGVPEFFGMLLQVRDIAHLTHLRQFNKSGWQHSALNSLYDEILDKADDIIESYQGIYGLVDFVVPSSSAKTDAIQWVTQVYDYIQTNRNIFSESWIQNEIDTICFLLAKTLYRLKFVQ